MEVDLNCDLGEGAVNDAAIMPLITSANVACGFHAGNAVTARQTIALAKRHGVAVGAHPGHADRDHFGRRELALEPDQVYVECVYQVSALLGVARVEQTEIGYIKPHGGLYHQANNGDGYADAVVAAACLFNLMVMGLPGSRLESRARGRCGFVAEGFADRRYRDDGSLVPRDQPNALIDDPLEAVAQVKRLLQRQGIRSICVHGDNPKAVDTIESLRGALLDNGFILRPFA